MKSRIIIAGLFALAFLGIQSCTKNDASKNGLNASDANLTTNLTAAIAVVATSELNKAGTADIQTLSVTNFDSIRGHHGPDFMGISGLMMKFRMPRISSCATVTVSGSTFPKTITIDYGSRCNSGRGHKMTGKIVINISDTLHAAGSVKTITYQSMVVDSMMMEYTGTIKNLGKNVNGNWVIANSYYQKTIGRNGHVVIENNADTLECVSGFSTADKSDDVFYKTGSGSISVNDSIKFRRDITKPLLYDNSCDYIKSGAIVLTKNGNTITTDFGDGTCDSVATVTTNGTTETIDLSTFRFHDNGRFDKHSPGGPHNGQKQVPGQGQGMGQGMGPGQVPGGFRFGF